MRKSIGARCLSLDFWANLFKCYHRIFQSTNCGNSGEHGNKFGFFYLKIEIFFLKVATMAESTEIGVVFSIISLRISKTATRISAMVASGP
jgi:hypothetical protein